ncbi:MULTISPECIES: hypothetical protein [unclassified Rhizobium]|uniref:hypothetical protein n=1 Tax=unclassified Rhizobium TaxID=2613769 RepID=UPI000A9D892A|nr:MULTISPECIES: hypothetical protein [unclassified Rhizobium]
MDRKHDRQQMAIYLVAIFVIACTIIGGGATWWNANHSSPEAQTQAASSTNS